MATMGDHVHYRHCTYDTQKQLFSHVHVVANHISNMPLALFYHTCQATPPFAYTTPPHAHLYPCDYNNSGCTHTTSSNSNGLPCTTPSSCCTYIIGDKMLVQSDIDNAAHQKHHHDNIIMHYIPSLQQPPHMYMFGREHAQSMMFTLCKTLDHDTWLDWHMSWTMLSPAQPRLPVQSGKCIFI